MASANSLPSMQSSPRSVLMSATEMSAAEIALIRNRVDNLMTAADSFANARIVFAGAVSGVDEMPHRLFKLERPGELALYGEYIFVFEENGINMEIGPFGYFDGRNLGIAHLNHPTVRRSFSEEECSAVQRLIQSFFSDLANLKELSSLSRFLGGVTFRSNWIIQKSPELS